MGEKYTIRRAGSTDLDALINFTRQEAKETEGVDPDPEAVERGVHSALQGTAPATYWIAESEKNQAVGSISVVTEWSNFRGGFYWWIQSLYIVPEHRGTGLVDHLLNTIAKEACAAGALDLRLYVLKSNERALGAYRRSGFDVSPYTILVRQLEKT